MWFKDLSEHEDLVKPIAEIKPLLEKYYKDSGRVIFASEYSMLHYRYILPLKQITKQTKLPVKPTNLRVLESDIAGPIAFHEVSLVKNKPELFETFMDKRFFSDFNNAVLRLKSKEKDETKGEIRQLSIPALNVDALWLHYGGGKVDKFVLIREFDLKDKEVYDENKFLILLNDLKYKMGKMKGQMGA